MTAQLNVPVVVHESPPGDDVARYPVIAVPPSLAGVLHETVAWALPATAETLSGAVGTFGNGGGVPLLIDIPATSPCWIGNTALALTASGLPTTAPMNGVSTANRQVSATCERPPTRDPSGKAGSGTGLGSRS